MHPVALLSRLPSGAQRDELLAAIQTGQTVAGVAWQEHAGEVEAGNGFTSATQHGEEVKLNGQKRFVRPGIGGDGWIVTANLDDTRALVWIAASSPGLRVDNAFGVDGSQTATLTFADAPAELANGRGGPGGLLDAANDARIAQSAELTGIARRSLDLTREYLTVREQFGKPIGSFQALQHRLVDGLIQVELAEACMREALESVNESNLPSVASRVKARCAYAATEMTRLAIQLHGAIGYDQRIRRRPVLQARDDLSSSWLGSATAHRRRRYAQLSRAMTAPPGRTHRDGDTEFPRDLDWDGMPEAEFRHDGAGLLRHALSRASPPHAVSRRPGRNQGLVHDAVAPGLDRAGVAEGSTAAWGCRPTS